MFHRHFRALLKTIDILKQYIAEATCEPRMGAGAYKLHTTALCLVPLKAEYCTRLQDFGKKDFNAH